MIKENENLSYVKLTNEELKQVNGGSAEENAGYTCYDCGFSCATKAELDEHKIHFHSGGMKKEELANP